MGSEQILSVIHSEEIFDKNPFDNFFFAFLRVYYSQYYTQFVCWKQVKVHRTIGATFQIRKNDENAGNLTEQIMEQ